MATCSLISTRFHSPSSSLFRSSTIKPTTTIHLSKTLHLHNPKLFILRLPSPKLTIPLLPKLSIPKPLLLLCTSLALSFTLLGPRVIVEVLRGDHKEKIPVILEPKPDES
ncbi:hypothetical protein V8G54_011486 [Vigna mungo]|uniref:Uncharacterized protein n=1 Tax=Vigna mungo TaxID=3915 RepID=A0AAQ3NP85_VIGMU